MIDQNFNKKSWMHVIYITRRIKLNVLIIYENVCFISRFKRVWAYTKVV